MQSVLRLLGRVALASGVFLIGGYFAMKSYGLAASFNLGHPAQFEFRLVPFWEIGLVAIAVGVGLMFGSHYAKRRNPRER